MKFTFQCIFLFSYLFLIVIYSYFNSVRHVKGITAAYTTTTKTTKNYIKPLPELFEWRDLTGGHPNVSPAKFTSVLSPAHSSGSAPEVSQAALSSAQPTTVPEVSSTRVYTRSAAALRPPSKDGRYFRYL